MFCDQMENGGGSETTLTLYQLYIRNNKSKNVLGMYWKISERGYFIRNSAQVEFATGVTRTPIKNQLDTTWNDKGKEQSSSNANVIHTVSVMITFM